MKIYNFCFLAVRILLAVFVITLVGDYMSYNSYVNSAPFYVFVLGICFFCYERMEAVQRYGNFCSILCNCPYKMCFVAVGRRHYVYSGKIFQKK